MTTNPTPEAVEAPNKGQTPENPSEDPQELLKPHVPGENPTPDPEEDAPEEGDTFPRAYVEKLRGESAKYRTEAKDAAARADSLAAALWQANVAATGKLADPTDLPFPEGVDPADPEAVTRAVYGLLDKKPHLAARVPRGNVGQGFTPEPKSASLLGMLRANAS